MMVSLPSARTAEVRGTMPGLKSPLIFTLAFGCCGAAKIKCLLNPEAVGKRFPCSGLPPSRIPFLGYRESPLAVTSAD